MKFVILGILACASITVAAPVPNDPIRLDKVQVSGNTFGDIVTIVLNVNTNIKTDIKQEIINVVVQLLQEEIENEDKEKSAIPETPGVQVFESHSSKTTKSELPNIDIRKLLKIAQKKLAESQAENSGNKSTE